VVFAVPEDQEVTRCTLVALKMYGVPHSIGSSNGERYPNGLHVISVPTDGKQLTAGPEVLFGFHKPEDIFHRM
jgi:hypothetical protein